MILLGVTNIEQSKLLGREALRTLLSPVAVNLQQRQALDYRTPSEVHYDEALPEVVNG